MGKVVNLDEFRRSKRKFKPSITLSLPNDSLSLDHYTVSRKIHQLMEAAADLDASVSFLPTVHLREQAVIKALKLRMEAEDLRIQLKSLTSTPNK